MADEPKIPDFKKIAEEALKDLPNEVALLAKNHFLKSFIKEGFEDTSFIAWPKRKDTDGHKLLSKSLSLRGSLKIDQATLKRIEVSAGEGLPYAAINNEGGVINVQVTKKMRKFFWYMFQKTKMQKYKMMALTKKDRFRIRIPKRQYIGESYTLNQEMDKKFINKIIEAQRKLKF